MNSNDFDIELKKLKIFLTKNQKEMLEKYYQMIIEYNKHTNLTRIIKKEELYLKHFYDSITISKVIELNNQKIIDIGTGAGFPGIVLKIVFPNIKLTLLDSSSKRTRFLESIVKEFGLKDVEIITKRAEEYVQNNRENFDIVVSRAVANLSILSELCIPYVKEKGYFISMKADATEEIKLSENAIKTLGGVIKDYVEFRLPFENSKRTLVKIEKIIKTDKKYPREFSKIKKNPL